MTVFAMILAGVFLFAAGILLARFLLPAAKGIPPEQYHQVQQEKTVAEQRLTDVRHAAEESKSELREVREQLTQLTAERASLKSRTEEYQRKLEEQKLWMEDFYKQNREQFENIAGRIVRDQSAELQQQHSQKLTDLLNPLKERIEKFENTVQHTHQDSIRQNQDLKTQLKQLQELNKSMSEEARNLTTALKGQVKTQGNWGEMILESVLERSGLIRGSEYLVQESFTDADGRRYQPDVVVKLPENKNIVIDSKVSLLAYERYCNAQDDAERDEALKQHLASIRKHMKSLGEKNYQHLYQINTLDFVLMFIPVEPALWLAIQKEPALYNDAFDNNIVLVSTSTLLATLRTIAGIWKLEYQNKNALEIARQGGAMYDKFVLLLNDFEKIGSSLDASHRAWEAARLRLGEGKGNLVRSAEKLKELGAKASKQIPNTFLNDDDSTDIPRQIPDSTA